MSYYGQAPGKGNGKGGYGQPYPPQAQYPPAGAESWDDHNTSYDQWGQGPPAPMPYNPPPPGYGGAPPTPGYGMAPPPAKPPAPYGYDPGYGGPRVNPGAGPWGGPAPYPGPAAPGLASEEIVQQQIDDKEREIQALRRQLEELEAQEGGPGPRGGPTPPGPGPGPPPNQPLPSPAPGLNTSAPSWRPPPAGAPMGYAVNGSAAPPAPHPGFAPPPRAWTGQVHVTDEEVKYCLERFDAEVRSKINQEVEDAIELGELPEGAEPMPEGEDDEDDEEGLPDDQEYWEFIKQQEQASGAAVA